MLQDKEFIKIENSIAIDTNGILYLAYFDNNSNVVNIVNMSSILKIDNVKIIDISSNILLDDNGKVYKISDDMEEVTSITDDNTSAIYQKKIKQISSNGNISSFIDENGDKYEIGNKSLEV